MAKNEFLPFGTAEGANVLSNQEYEALAARHNGFNSGVAKSKELNKVWRQASLIASAVAQFIVDTDQKDLLDTGDVADIKSRLASAINLIISNGDYVTNPYLKLELLKKIDKADITQQLGNDTSKVASQNLLTIELGKKASVADANSKLAKDQNGADIPNKPKFIENLGLPELLDKKFDKTGGEITDTVTIKRGWEALVIESGASGVPSQINFKEGGIRTAFVGYGSNGSKHLGLVNDKTGTSFHVNDNDISVNGKSVMVGLVPIGGTIIWNSSAPYPDNFWPNEGRSFSAADYPELAKVFSGLKLPDDRGYAIRAADNGKGIDTGRVVGTYQGDAIRNIYGGFGARGNGTYEISGAMKVTTTTNWQVNDFAAAADGGNRKGVTVYMDASTIVPTADENRMKNVAKILITRVK